jgi:hypothetical protein
MHSPNDPTRCQIDLVASCCIALIAFTSDKPFNTSQYSRMDANPRKSLPKRMFSKITKPFKSKSRAQSRERPVTGQPQDTLGIDQPDRAASAPPDIPQASTEQIDAPVLSSSALAPSTRSLMLGDSAIDPLSDAPLSGQTVSTAQIGEPSVTSVAPAPISTIGTTAIPSSLKPSLLKQTTKFVGKGLLGLLSSAADGVPVPGVKGICDAIIKFVNVIEVGRPNGF